MSSIVTLTTDFGEADAFVACTKGAIYSGCPDVELVDLSHEIPRGNVREAALFIAEAIPYFPKDTIHIVAVASGRIPLAVSINEQIVICPDNGVLTLLAERHLISEARAITNPDLHPAHGGQTYFSRDIFAPAAALLASGGPFEDVGDVIENVAILDLPKPEKESKNRITGTIMHVNRFGTLVSNIHESFLEGATVNNVEVGTFALDKLSDSYGDVEPGCPVALFGSGGYLEFAYNGDRADKRLNMGVGIIVNVGIEPVGA